MLKCFKEPMYIDIHTYNLIQLPDTLQSGFPTLLTVHHNSQLPSGLANTCKMYKNYVLL